MFLTRLVYNVSKKIESSFEHNRWTIAVAITKSKEL